MMSSHWMKQSAKKYACLKDTTVQLIFTSIIYQHKIASSHELKTSIMNILKPSYDN